MAVTAKKGHYAMLMRAQRNNDWQMYGTCPVCLPAGSKLLAASLAECEGDDMIKQALLHVHTANEEALEWYQHRGFKVGMLPGLGRLCCTLAATCDGQLFVPVLSLVLVMCSSSAGVCRK